jgi:hypothetical protein
MFRNNPKDKSEGEGKWRRDGLLWYVTMDMEAKYMEPKVNAKLKSNP